MARYRGLLAACLAVVAMASPSHATTATTMPEWSVGSWRLVDVYTFDNLPKILSDHYKLSLAPLVGKRFVKIGGQGFDLLASSIIPRFNSDVIVTRLRSGLPAVFPSLSATSITSGRKIHTHSLTHLVSIEAKRCSNQDDGSDSGVIPCVSPIMAEAGPERVMIYFTSSRTSRPSATPCLWELRRD